MYTKRVTYSIHKVHTMKSMCVLVLNELDLTTCFAGQWQGEEHEEQRKRISYFYFLLFFSFLKSSEWN